MTKNSILWRKTEIKKKKEKKPTFYNINNDVILVVVKKPFPDIHDENKI